MPNGLPRSPPTVYSSMTSMLLARDAMPLKPTAAFKLEGAQGFSHDYHMPLYSSRRRWKFHPVLGKGLEV